MLGTTLKLRYNSVKKFRITDGIAFFILLSYIIGFIIGALLIRSQNDVFINYSSSVFTGSVLAKDSQPFFSQLFDSFLLIFPFLLLSFVFGTSIIGCVFIPAVNVFKGMYDGLLISYIYNTYSVSGMGFTVLVIAPGTILFAYLLLLGCRESMCFSDRVLKNTLPKGTAYNLASDFKLYSVRYLIILLLAFSAAFLDCAIAKLFIKYFEL